MTQEDKQLLLKDLCARLPYDMWVEYEGFAHIVNREATVDIDGKPYKPISHNGWNIPAVEYWMPKPIVPEEEKQ